MKFVRLIVVILFILFAPLGVWAQTPTLVQHVSGSNYRNGQSSASPNCYTMQLPNLTIAGNAVIVGFTFQSNPTPTVTDDKGDTYTIRVNSYDSTDSRSFVIAAAFNVAAGARVLQVCFSSFPGGFIQPMATEFANVTGIDGTGAANTGTGTTLTAGSLTPTQTGDLIYQIAVSDLAFTNSLHQSSFMAGSQSNIAWNLMSADLMDGWAGQFGVYNSTSAINPTMAMGASLKWGSAAILLKAGSAGSIPSAGMRIIRLIHENIPYKVGGGGNGSSFTNPETLQFPSSGNLLVAVGGAGNNGLITAIKDTRGNSWVQAGSTHSNGNDAVGIFYAASATSANNLGLTVTFNNNASDQTILFYDVTGAASSPLDTTNGLAEGVGGTCSALGNCTPPFTITPSKPNELIFAIFILDDNTAVGLAGSGQLFDSNMYSGESLNGPEPIDENNGWGHYYDPNTSAVSFTWVPWQPGAIAFRGYASMAAAFQGASSSGTGPVPPTNLSVTVQ